MLMCKYCEQIVPAGRQQYHSSTVLVFTVSVRVRAIRPGNGIISAFFPLWHGFPGFLILAPHFDTKFHESHSEIGVAPGPKSVSSGQNFRDNTCIFCPGRDV